MSLLKGWLSERSKMVSQAVCLAMIMWGEARGEGTQGMIATAYTAVHRSEHYYFPKDVCQVMKQPGQYNFMQHKLPTTDEIKPLIPIAEMILKKKIQDPTKGAMYFHEKSIKPSWARNKPVKIAIGNHIFY
ncbi:cell wall hydrolase [bacterium]|nr:cell wall hydrolase [bacterium]